eukprot:2610585-Rhodomonas_salina.1
MAVDRRATGADVRGRNLPPNSYTVANLNPKKGNSDDPKKSREFSGKGSENATFRGRCPVPGVCIPSNPVRVFGIEFLLLLVLVVVLGNPARVAGSSDLKLSSVPDVVTGNRWVQVFLLYYSGCQGRYPDTGYPGTVTVTEGSLMTVSLVGLELLAIQLLSGNVLQLYRRVAILSLSLCITGHPGTFESQNFLRVLLLPGTWVGISTVLWFPSTYDEYRVP